MKVIATLVLLVAAVSAIPSAQLGNIHISNTNIFKHKIESWKLNSTQVCDLYLLYDLISFNL